MAVLLRTLVYDLLANITALALHTSLKQYRKPNRTEKNSGHAITLMGYCVFKTMKLQQLRKALQIGAKKRPALERAGRC